MVSRSRRNGRRTASTSPTISPAVMLVVSGISECPLPRWSKYGSTCSRASGGRSGRSPFQVQPGAAVEHDHRVRAITLHPVKEPHATFARDEAGSPKRLLSLPYRGYLRCVAGACRREDD